MAGSLSRGAVALVALLLAAFPLSQVIGAQTLPQVNITATDGIAAEIGANTGTLTVSRTGDTLAPLTVNYSVGGSALAGSDYSALSGSVIIPAGASLATITVTPLDDLLVEGSETVLVTLVASSTYTVGSSLTAKVTIRDNEVVDEDDEDNDVHEGDARPGWGWGDLNHEHFGPPGQGCSADDSCVDHDATAGMTHTDSDVDDDDNDAGPGHGRGHEMQNHGRGHDRH